jgi:hypothetical protein
VADVPFDKVWPIFDDRTGKTIMTSPKETNESVTIPCHG